MMINAPIARAIGIDQVTAAAPNAARGIRISSVAYATDERASDESTARALVLPIRSCSTIWLDRGSPSKSLFIRVNTMVGGSVSFQRLGESTPFWRCVKGVRTASSDGQGAGSTPAKVWASAQDSVGS